MDTVTVFKLIQAHAIDKKYGLVECEKIHALTMYYAMSRIPGKDIEVSHAFGEAVCGRKLYPDVIKFLRRNGFISARATAQSMIYTLEEEIETSEMQLRSNICPENIKTLIFKYVKSEYKPEQPKMKVFLPKGFRGFKKQK